MPIDFEQIVDNFKHNIEYSKLQRGFKTNPCLDYHITDVPFSKIVLYEIKL